MRKSNLIYHLINAAIFIFLEIAALNMLAHNGTLQGTWISRGAQNVAGFFWGTSQKISDYFSLQEKNDALAQENYELRLRLEKIQAMITYNEEAQMMLAGNTAGGYSYIPAEISKISNNSQHNYMILGKGSNDGISKGSGVITGKGAVGVIDAVSENFSYARSFKNRDMSISTRIGKRGVVGPMSWDGRSNDKAILKEIPHHVEFSQGDTVYTSGFSSIFPPDIPLGTLGESRIVNGSTYEIKVTLFEDFGSLRYVTVVENLGRNEMKTLEDMR